MIHDVEVIQSLVKSEVVNIQACSVKTADRPEGKDYITAILEFENGATAEYVTVDGKFMMFNTIVITNTTEGSTDHCFYTDNKQFYRAMMEKVIERMEGVRDVLTTCEDMAKSIKVMLAGKASLDLSAGEVKLDSPLLYEVSYDGNAFEREYAAAASKMYTNL
jgi:predicted dehydrogenase